MPEKPILNKGLDALLGDVEQPNANIVKNIPTNKIAPNRYQPRTSFNDEKLSELADSIKQHGILSPIIVREASLDQYEIIAGERRFRAAKNLKLKEVPCLIENTENQQSLEIALIENLQRENLNPVEEASSTGFKFSRWRFSINAISRDCWFSVFSMRHGTSLSFRFFAALNLRSPAIISY